MIVKVTSAKYLHDYVLELHFDDGSHGQVDFRLWIAGRGGLFAALEDLDAFKQYSSTPKPEQSSGRTGSTSVLMSCATKQLVREEIPNEMTLRELRDSWSGIDEDAS